MSARGKLVLDGTDDFVSTGHAGIGGAGARTVCAWVKTAEGVGGYFFSYGENATLKNYRMTVSPADNFVKVASKTHILAGDSIIGDGTWHFVASSYDGTNLRIFADNGVGGSEIEQENASTPVLDTGIVVDVVIGATEIHTAEFTGNLSDVMFFDDDLSLAELQEIYDLGRNPDHGQVAGLSTYTELVSWWPFTINADDEKGGNDGTFEGNAYVDIEANVPVANHHYQIAGAL